MQPTAIVEMNRGRLRGWIFVGGALLAVLAALSWPDLPVVIVGASLAAAMLAAGVWIQFSIPDAEDQS